MSVWIDRLWCRETIGQVKLERQNVCAEMYPVQSLSELFHSHIQLHLFCWCRRQPFLSISDLWDVWFVPFSFKQLLISQTARVLFMQPLSKPLWNGSSRYQRSAYFFSNQLRTQSTCANDQESMIIQTRRPKNRVSTQSPFTLMHL